MPTITLKHSTNCLWKGKLRLWLELLCFAQKYGWKPAGSRKARGDGQEWNGDYELPLGQIVSDTDARAFANALRHGLQATSLLFTTDARAAVRKVINFCQQGEFEIVAPRGCRAVNPVE